MITPKKIHEITHTAEWYGKPMTISTGKLAPHCDGSIVITVGETTLLVTAVINKNPDPDKSFTPLAVDFRESFYAAGKIWGGRFNKREGRPGDEVVLYSRLIDRALRPLFPKGMTNDVIVTISPLSLDMEHNPWEIGIIWASLAIMAAGIPLDGPVGATRICYKDGNYLINPTESALVGAELDLHLAGPSGKINMIEAGANECPMDILKQAFVYGQESIDQIIQIQQWFLKQLEISPKEILINYPTDQQFAEMETVVTMEDIATLQDLEKNEFDTRYKELEQRLYDHFKPMVEAGEGDRKGSTVGTGFFNMVKKYIRKNVTSKQMRIDSRGLDDIRSIYCEVGLAPRVHGTGLFRRGETQVLSLLTLWAPGDSQILDDMETNDGEKRFMHHYKMPPFSNNEAQMIRWSNRREIGHGRLAEKAIEPMLPSKEDFPYTIRIVSEVLGSGGSTSMASVCGSTMALLDAGVKIRKPISGIAMGMITSDSDEYVLTDISGTEDFIGDMDFKLAGSDEGMTAIQMDIKIHGITVAKIHEIIDRAQAGRSRILAHMMQTIDTPRAQLSQYAPCIHSFKVAPEQVRDIIGPGGSIIQDIIRQSNGVSIDIEDDGSGFITGKVRADVETAMQMIEQITWKPAVWYTCSGKITRVEKYGAFVDIGGKKTGLVHVKQMGLGFVDDLTAHAKVWDILSVEITGIDPDGKIQLKKVG